MKQGNESSVAEWVQLDICIWPYSINMIDNEIITDSG